MNIVKNRDGSALCIALEGRLDTMGAPILEDELMTCLDGVTDLTFDFARVEYVSSAGIRVMVRALRMMHGKGTMKIINANEMAREVFHLTGADGYLNIV